MAVARAPDSSSGRRNGASAPASRASAAYSSESVDTMTRARLLRSAVRIVRTSKLSPPPNPYVHFCRRPGSIRIAQVQYLSRSFKLYAARLAYQQIALTAHFHPIVLVIGMQPPDFGIRLIVPDFMERQSPPTTVSS